MRLEARRLQAAGAGWRLDARGWSLEAEIRGCRLAGG